ncbi:MAG TPA: hypothetical protein DDY04_07630 [Bacteroidales bacterium]|nr:hypothetical protein [Bacteroidales bacterium]
MVKKAKTDSMFRIGGSRFGVQGSKLKIEDSKLRITNYELMIPFSEQRTTKSKLPSIINHQPLALSVIEGSTINHQPSTINHFHRGLFLLNPASQDFLGIQI